MYPRYSIENHEGGTPTLETDNPGLSRQKLSVCNPEEWKRQKHKLIYESWIKATKAQIDGKD